MAGPAAGSLWVNHAAPFAAIYQTADVTFTYVSDQPAEQADDGVAALVRHGAATAGAAAGRRTGSRRAGPGAAERGPAGTVAAPAASAGWAAIMELLAP